MSGSWSGGKGDRNRSDKKKFDEGYERIFGASGQPQPIFSSVFAEARKKFYDNLQKHNTWHSFKMLLDQFVKETRGHL